MKAKYRRMCGCEDEGSEPLPQVNRNDYDGYGDHLEVEFGIVCGQCRLPYMEIPDWEIDYRSEWERDEDAS
jgi:hypothetical protein